MQLAKKRGAQMTTIDRSIPTTEQTNRKTARLSVLPTRTILKIINDEDRKVAEAVRREIPAIDKAVDLIVERLKKGGRLIYVGAGTSGRLAILDASELMPTFGVGPKTVLAIIAGGRRAITHPAEGAEDSSRNGANALRKIGVRKTDAVLGISASGRTPFVLGALTYSKSRHALTIALTSNPNSPISNAAQLTICPKTGSEVITGSTRMKAGTAQKLVLNMISTVTMLKLGRTFGPLMVNVQPISTKLVNRATRIVALATGLKPNQAKRRLKEASMNVPAAILMTKTKLTYRKAARLLRTTRGSLQAAIALAESKPE